MGFDRYIGIDWSGAKGHRHKGIALAIAAADGAIELLKPSNGGAWSRQGVVDFIGACAPATAVAMDSSFSLPFIDDGRYLPGLHAHDAPSLWREVEEICAAEKDLFGGAFVERFADHYQQSANAGSHFRRRYRVTEDWYNDAFRERSESCYHLIGPSQIGKGGIATMRALYQLAEYHKVKIWPFDPIDFRAIMMFEAFATTWRDGHRAKIRDVETLQRYLTCYGCFLADPAIKSVSDDEADACLMAAGLRSLFDLGAKGPYVPDHIELDVLKKEGWIITKGPPCKS